LINESSEKRREELKRERIKELKTVRMMRTREETRVVVEHREE